MRRKMILLRRWHKSINEGRQEVPLQIMTLSIKSVAKRCLLTGEIEEIIYHISRLENL